MKKEYLEEIIANVNDRIGIDSEILEKDYYVCLILKELSNKQKELKAYFKGGTAIYKIISNMNRFSEDIDLTVKVLKNTSNNSNKMRLKKSALGYKIDDLILEKEKTIDKKGSVTSFYKYESLFNENNLFKPGVIQIESTSFTVSEPTATYNIEPLIYKFATDNEKKILKEKCGVSNFKIKTIKLERIFVDKIFAAEFYYEREMYGDASKHLYDISILMDNDDVKKMLNDEKELIKLIGYKRKEEKARIGGIKENQKILEFKYMKLKFTEDFIRSFNKMQEIYVFSDDYKLTIKDIKKILIN